MLKRKTQFNKIHKNKTLKQDNTNTKTKTTYLDGSAESCSVIVSEGYDCGSFDRKPDRLANSFQFFCELPCLRVVSFTAYQQPID
jgi:hypothetical protein